MFKDKKNIILIIVALILLALPNVVTSKYLLHIFITSLLYIIVAQGLNILVGLTKYTSFANAAFYGVGAYTSAILTRTLGLSFWISLPISVIFTAIIAFAAGYFPLRMRLKGSYFSVTTMALGSVIMAVIHNQEPLTGGPAGFPSIPSPGSFFGLAIESRKAFYYLILVFAIVVLIFVKRLMNSKLGRAFKSIGQDEDTAESIGINVGYYKILCFIMSAAITSIAGVLFAHYSRFLGPDMFTTIEASDHLTMVILGGMGTIVGPIIGAIVVVVLPEVLRFLAEYRQIIFSLIVILTILFMPQGLYGLIRSLKARYLAGKSNTAVTKARGVKQ
ncbi:MAG: branched-chain amino acid ABC transporter permease [Peptococcia bacterium]